MFAKKLKILLLLLLIKPVWGQDSLNVTHLGQWNYWGTTQGIALSGSYAYVTESQYGLRVVDVSDPADMEEIGQCALNGADFCVAVNGCYAYVGMYNSLRIVDITNPAAPETLGICTTNDWVRSVVIVYPYVYVAASGEGLVIINVSPPTAPVIVGRFDSPGYAHEVAVAGTLAYLADGERGFWIVDISNPTRPRPIGHRDTPYYAHALTVADPLVYVLDGEGLGGWGSGLTIFDATDPTQPVLLGTCGPYVEATDVKVNGNYAYVAIPGRGLRIIDVSDPTAPQEVCIFHDDGCAAEIELSGSLAYTNGEGLTALDLANPLAPVQIGNYHPEPGAREVVVEGDYAYICKYGRGLDILDVSDPMHPRWLGFCDSPVDAEDVAVRLPYAYLADGYGGLRIIDVSDPENPVEVGFYDPGVCAYEVALNYPYAYLACWTAGLSTINISDPTAPVQVSSWSYFTTTCVTVAGSYAYVGTGTYTPLPGLRTFSLANPASPLEVSGVTFTGQIYEIAITGSYACVATGSGLRIVDISNVSSPTLVYAGSSWSSYDLDASGSLVYLSDQTFALRVLNISNPATPVEVGYYQLFGYGAQGIDVVDSIAYLGREYLFDIYDCSAAINPPPVTITLTPFFLPLTIPASGGSFNYFVNLSNITTLPQTLDAWAMVRLPNNNWYGPVLGPFNLTLPDTGIIARLRTQTVPAGAPAGSYFYEGRVGDYPNAIWDTSGFAFTKLGSENQISGFGEWFNTGEPFSGEVEAIPNSSRKGLTTFIIHNLNASPNPFNPSTVISFELRVPSLVRLEVFDVKGRNVGVRPRRGAWLGDPDYVRSRRPPDYLRRLESPFRHLFCEIDCRAVGVSDDPDYGSEEAGAAQIMEIWKNGRMEIDPLSQREHLPHGVL